MAWRLIAKKDICSSFVTVVVSTTRGGIHLASGSLKKIPDIFSGGVPRSVIDVRVSNRCYTIRAFHGTPGLLYRRAKEEAPGLKAPKIEKRVKREPRTQAPVEAPYVPPKQKLTLKSSPDKTVDIFEGMTILELAKGTGASIGDLQEILTAVGEKVDSEFDPVSIDIAELVAMEVGVNVRRLHSDEGSVLQPRPPVVTVMGHVDHGKTSLLDALRQTSVAAREAGGITQHLGAFVVSMPSGASITFLDTPGHAAFSAMRARGAAITDIVVLVVAADDGVMPQTLEAMAHAKAANVPIVVAINKCDKPAADPERVRIQLGSEGLLLEDLGGDVQVVEVSALSKTGLDKLEEALLLQAEMMDLKARIDGPAQAFVVEARLDRGRGPLATAIVKAGTLLSGQHIVVGAEWGKIRAIRDTTGKVSELASPAMPVEIEGLKGLPMAGDDVVVVESEERARMLSSGRKKKFEKDRLHRVCGEGFDISDTSEEAPERVELPIIVKADVQGTVQAVTDALRSLNSPQHHSRWKYMPSYMLSILGINDAGLGVEPVTSLGIEALDGWCDSQGTLEEIRAKIQTRQEGAMKRESAIAYSLSQQTPQGRSSPNLKPSSSLPSLNRNDIDKNNTGWSWLERWMATKPWENRLMEPTDEFRATSLKSSEPGSVKIKKNNVTTRVSSKPPTFYNNPSGAPSISSSDFHFEESSESSSTNCTSTPISSTTILASERTDESNTSRPKLHEHDQIDQGKAASP